MSGESKNNPTNRVKAPEKLTRRLCDDGCGQLIPAHNMITVMSTAFSPTGKISSRRKHFIKEHYKAA